MAEAEKVACKHAGGFRQTPGAIHHDGPVEVFYCKDCDQGFVGHQALVLETQRVTTQARAIIEKQTAEWVFLIQRLVDTGSGGVAFNEGREQGRGRKTGISSNALIRHVLTGGLPPMSCYPADRFDYEACVRAADDLPPHLKEDGHKILDLYWAYLSGRMAAQNVRVPA